MDQVWVVPSYEHCSAVAAGLAHSVSPLCPQRCHGSCNTYHVSCPTTATLRVVSSQPSQYFRGFEQRNPLSRGSLWPRAVWCGPGWFPLQGPGSKQHRHEQVHNFWHHSLALFYLAVWDYCTVLILGREKGKTNIQGKQHPDVLICIGFGKEKWAYRSRLQSMTAHSPLRWAWNPSK